MYRRTVILLGLLLCSVFPGRAQWTGSVDLSGGYGFMRSADEETFLSRGLGKGTFHLGYKKQGFQWSNTLNAGFENLSTEVARVSARITDNLEEGVNLSGDLKSKKSNPWSLTFRTEALWTPSAHMRHRAWFQYGFRDEYGENYTTSQSGLNGFDSMSAYIDTPISKTHQVELGYNMSRQLGSPRRVLLGVVSLSHNFRDQYTGWIVYEQKQTGEESLDVYRITPHSAQTTVNAAVHMKDSVLVSGPSRLLLDPGVRLTAGRTRDNNSGATLVDVLEETWRDSTRLREDFRFFTLAAEPFVAADFKWKNLSVHADYGLQIYARRLTSDQHPSHGMDFVKPSLVGNSRVVWTLSDGHTLQLGSNSSVSHPNYVQTCWYERPGAYVSQVYRGSTSLESTRTHSLNLGYTFKYKGLTATLTGSVMRRLGDVEQTYSNEDIGGKTYQVFTWINASDTWGLGLDPKVSWNGKNVRGSVGVNLNQSFLKSRISGEVKKTHNWGLTAAAACFPGKGWSVDADVKYRSSVSSFFTSFSEYWTLNMKVQKSFKRLTVYLQGRDLLDAPVTAEFLSADGLEWWAEESRENRRIILLGLNWKF